MDETKRRELEKQGLIGTPEDVARTALFLVENKFVNGVTVGVDGGLGVAWGN